uniref:DUF86 domain-containing protein n=1 Tax=candidate division CPR3 bacterium TaxID=2268181 RepID=A0A7C4R5B7_UNCC3
MKKDREIFLKDVLDAIGIIQEYTKRITFVKFSQDLMVQDAVERRFIVIGEAFSRYKYSTPENNPDFPYVQAISMKNFLVHEYEKIKPEIVWKTIKKDLPALKKKIDKLLK